MTPGDGPKDLHVALPDNGRSDALSDAVGRQSLRPIPCSACLTCPVYGRTGGHAYGSTYPDPIGMIITPLLLGSSTTSDRLAALRVQHVRGG